MKYEQYCNVAASKKRRAWQDKANTNQDIMMTVVMAMKTTMIVATIARTEQHEEEGR